METKTIGERIKELRMSRRITQEDLGELLGVKKAAIQKYENGGIVNLKIDTVENLAKIFNVSPSYIMGWEKFDNKYDLDAIKFEIMAIESLQETIGESALVTLGAMYTMNNDAKEKVKQYALDLCMIDAYVNKDKRNELKEKYPTANPLFHLKKSK